jgi:hypothetical protein
MKNQEILSDRHRYRLKAIKTQAMRLSVLLGLYGGGAAFAADEAPLGQLTPNWRVFGEVRARYEASDFFQPAVNPPGIVNNHNDYSFGAIRARLGVLFNSDYLEALVQGQYVGLYDLPTHAFGGPAAGPLGVGGAYYQDSGHLVNPNEVFLKQGYLNFKLQKLVAVPNTTLKGGRFEFNEGLEYKTGDAKFDGLKASRVSGRLIGTFDFSNVSRSFDGFSTAYDDPNLNVTLFASHPTQGGFNVHGEDEISKIDLGYAGITAKKGLLLPDAEARLFYIYYGDHRSNVSAVDNRTATGAVQTAALARNKLLSNNQLSIHTIGTHLLGVSKVGTGSADYMTWGAYQFGDWTNQSQSAYAFDAEGGYQWTDVMFKPWLRAGYFIGSGDTNAKDGTHGTFFNVIPTVRLYAKFPFFNMMNIQDAFTQFITVPIDNTKLGVDFHYLSLAENADLFYGGSGATSRSGSFGYFGRKGGNNSTVGEMVDITFTHTLNRYFSWTAYYAHAFGSDVTRNTYQLQNNANYGYVEFTASF